MKRMIVLLFAGCLLSAGIASAQDGPIKQRQALMKKNGDAMKVVVPMVKGEKPYDAEAAAEAMRSISGTLDEFVTLFPEGSIGDSAAKPEIWENKADFESRATELKAVALKTADAAAGGMESFQKAFGEVGNGCKGCHEKYRVKKEK